MTSVRDDLGSDSQHDVAVIGSGFGGSLMAMILRRLGRSVVLLERGKHPRVVIGESSTPLANLLLEELATRYSLPGVGELTKWGRWQATHPELACGLKRGFSFFHHALGQPEATIDRQNQLLIAASPHDGIADTHWYRADFDNFFAKQAQECGVDYLDEIDLKECADEGCRIVLRGFRQGRDLTIKARFVVDATGPRGYLHRALKLEERTLSAFPATQALYCHFSDARRVDELYEGELWEQAPYPVDDAAVHHIFEGGWVWGLRFNNGITSAGVVAVDKLANNLGFAEGEHGWNRLMELIPTLRWQFAEARAVQPFRHIGRVGFRSASITGLNWALLPSAAGFVDPLLSTGFPLNLLGIARLAEIIERNWGADSFNTQLADYAARTDDELLATSRLIGALYTNMGNFEVFATLSLLYFAAASYAETALRLKKPHLARSFLLHDHPLFGYDSKRVLERARSVRPGKESEELIEDIFRVIEPFDVAGFGRRDRRNWYPVEAEDLVRSAGKVGTSRDEVMRMLARCGFSPATLRS